jgi:hypothetical protein
VPRAIRSPHTSQDRWSPLTIRADFSAKQQLVQIAERKLPDNEEFLFTLWQAYSLGRRT